MNINFHLDIYYWILNFDGFMHKTMEGHFHRWIKKKKNKVMASFYLTTETFFSELHDMKSHFRVKNLLIAR